MSEQPGHYQIGGHHYLDMAVQPWDVVDTWPVERQIGFHHGNVVKYTLRAGAKGSVLEDLRKARHYLDKLIDVIEKNQVTKVSWDKSE